MKGLIIAASIAVVLMVSAIALVIVNADGTATASQSATTQPDTATTEPEPTTTESQTESAEPETDSADPESSPSLPEFMEERLQDLLEQGFISEEQLDEIDGWFRDHHWWDGELPEGFDPDQLRERFHEHAPWNGEHPEEFLVPRSGPHGFGFFHGHEDLLDLLDVTPEELMDALAEGTPLIDLIDDPEAFLDSLLAPMEERLDQAVEEGHVTQSEADELLAEARTRAEAFINGEMTEGEWLMGRRGPRGLKDFGESGPRNRPGSEAEPAEASA
jgi:hypothetical protein